jgi:hypothetical protein
MAEYKVNDRVVTTQGPGTVVSIDNNEGKSKRYGVELDDNPYYFSPVYYWPDELKYLNSNKPQ